MQPRWHGRRPWTRRFTIGGSNARQYFIFQRGWGRELRDAHSQQSGRALQLADEPAQLFVGAQLGFEGVALGGAERAQHVEAGLFLLLLVNHT